ncbi:MAG: peptidoglycan-binding domain-containing protein [Bacteroidia bacterium]
MKKLLLILVPLAIIWYLYNQYVRYRRFHPPSAYDYAVNDSIDAHYFDAAKVLQYYQTAQEVGSIARNAWFEHFIDVRLQSSTDAEAKPYILRYQQAIATAKMLEKQLILSAKWKKMGLKNEDIRLLETSGTSIENMASVLLKGTVLKRDDIGTLVYKAQDLLKKKGYDLPVDGYFEQKTEAAVRAFQAQQKLYVTGKIDDLTLSILLK